MFRWLLLGLLGWIAYRLWGQYTSAKSAMPTVHRQPPVTAVTMVKCEHCELHLPEQQAIHDGTHWFCCAEHKSEFTAK